MGDGEYWGEVNDEGRPHGFGVWVDKKSGVIVGYYADGKEVG